MFHILTLAYGCTPLTTINVLSSSIQCLINKWSKFLMITGYVFLWTNMKRAQLYTVFILFTIDQIVTAQ